MKNIFGRSSKEKIQGKEKNSVSSNDKLDGEILQLRGDGSTVSKLDSISMLTEQSDIEINSIVTDVVVEEKSCRIIDSKIDRLKPTLSKQGGVDETEYLLAEISIRLADDRKPVNLFCEGYHVDSTRMPRDTKAQFCS